LTRASCKGLARRRLARELHDTVAQALAAMVLNLSRFQEPAGALDPAVERVPTSSLGINGEKVRPTARIAGDAGRGGAEDDDPYHVERQLPPVWAENPLGPGAIGSRIFTITFTSQPFG